MRMNAIHPALTTAALAAFLFTGMPAVAEVVSYKADLKGSAEVPPNDTLQTGLPLASMKLVPVIVTPVPPVPPTPPLPPCPPCPPFCPLPPITFHL